MPNPIVLNMIDRLKITFKDIIVGNKKDDHRVNRPFIDERTLSKKLSNAFKKYAIDQDTFYNLILEKNEQYKTYKRESGESGITSKMLEKCNINGCYLGLDKDFEWIDSIILYK
jgi:hypothetical protein